MREKCYFAYCSDNLEKIKDLMLYLKQTIEAKSNNTVEVILDLKDFRVSENFKENEKKILKSDSVIIFFSPAYKAIIDESKESRGTYREYSLILKVWKEKISLLFQLLSKVR